jgi:hypothetical protein
VGKDVFGRRILLTPTSRHLSPFSASQRGAFNILYFPYPLCGEAGEGNPAKRRSGELIMRHILTIWPVGVKNASPFLALIINERKKVKQVKKALRLSAFARKQSATNSQAPYSKIKLNIMVCNPNLLSGAE